MLTPAALERARPGYRLGYTHAYSGKTINSEFLRRTRSHHSVFWENDYREGYQTALVDGARPEILENHLHQFEDRFAALTDQQRRFLRTRLFERYIHDKNVQTTDEDIILMCRRLGVDHADIVLSVSDTPDASALETLIGRPIIRERPVTSTQRRVRSRTTRSDPRIIVAVVDNPKKPGSKSFDRYAHYEIGITVDEAISRGVTRADIRYDTEHKYIQLETAS